MIKITKKTIFYGVIIFLLLILLCKDHYEDYINDIKSDRQNQECQQDDITNEMKKLVKEKNKSLIDKMIISSKEGFMKGGVTGCITGGIPGAISGGFLFGVANPIIIFVNESKTNK